MLIAEKSLKVYGLAPIFMMDTQHSALRILTPHSGFPHSNTLSAECRVLSIRHKSGAWSQSRCRGDSGSETSTGLGYREPGDKMFTDGGPCFMDQSQYNVVSSVDKRLKYIQ